MQLTETIKLILNKEQKELLQNTMTAYIETVNCLLELSSCGMNLSSFSSKDVAAPLPSALKNQALRDAVSIIRKHRKECRKAVRYNRKHSKKKTVSKMPVVGRPCFYVNNQNFKVDKDSVSFSVLIDGKLKRIKVKALVKRYDLFADKSLGTLRVVVKNNKIVAQVVYEVDEAVSSGDKEMGVDLGIKCPAVSADSDGRIRFYGNGRKNKYMRRHYAYLRRKAQKAKKMSAVKKIRDKEQRIMCDIDHKISRQVVNEAVRRGVKTIKLETLSNIRETTRKSRKNNRSLHSWSFYRLAQFIEYKAKMAGIEVVYVNPAYTSQTCPKCGRRHHAKDRQFKCACGYEGHRDAVGAINILTAPVGDSNIRQAA